MSTDIVRSLADIDSDLEVVCAARAKTLATKVAATQNAERAERVALTCDYHVASCDQRITELLDERLRV